MEQFYNQLEANRKPLSDDPYCRRVTHCYLMMEKPKEEFHFFEVREWGKIGQDKLKVSAVSWTAATGTCQIEINDDNTDTFNILTHDERDKLFKTLELIREPTKQFYRKKGE